MKVTIFIEFDVQAFELWYHNKRRKKREEFEFGNFVQIKVVLSKWSYRLKRKKNNENIKRPFPGCYNASYVYVLHYDNLIEFYIYLQQNYCVNKLLSIFIE